MKTQLFSKLVKLAVFMPALSFAQIDLVPGINFQYTPPSSCNNQVTSISVDVCNNGAGNVTTPFVTSMYLYDSGSGKHWCIGSTTVNSLSGNACITISNWNIDITQAPVVPPAGYYKLGVWVDTANSVTETNYNNNSGILSSSADVQVCASSAVQYFDTAKDVALFPVPARNDLFVKFVSAKEETLAITIRDISGKEVKVISNEKLSAGNHLVQTDISGLENGIYFLSICSSELTLVKKFVVNR